MRLLQRMPARGVGQVNPRVGSIQAPATAARVPHVDSFRPWCGESVGGNMCSRETARLQLSRARCGGTPFAAIQTSQRTSPALFSMVRDVCLVPHLRTATMTAPHQLCTSRLPQSAGLTDGTKKAPSMALSIDVSPSYSGHKHLCDVHVFVRLRLTAPMVYDGHIGQPCSSSHQFVERPRLARHSDTGK
jgi:hypothetical protein